MSDLLSATADTAPAPHRRHRILGMRVTPLTVRRLHNFRKNRRGFWSMWIFLTLFVLSLFAEFIANDRPLVVGFEGQVLFPVLA